MGSLSATNPSLWVESTPITAYPRLSEAQAAVDVAVIGGGITGLTTALLLRRQGATVALVEAGHLCSGVTGYTTAKVSSLHGLLYASLADSYGDETARLYGEAQEAAITKVEQLVTDLGIDCDFSRRQAFTYTSEGDSVSSIEEEVEVASRLGLPASFTTDTELPYAVAGAVRFDDQAQFHPRQYCLGLAAALVAEGGLVFERTRALGVDEEEGGCRVKTEHGELRSGTVVVATHIPFLDRGGYFATCHPTRSYAMAVELETPVPRNMYLSIDTPSRSVRAAMGDTVAILGGEGHKTGQDEDTRERYAALEEWAGREFEVREIRNRWSAQDYVPADGLPFIGPQTKDSRIHVATGFKKWGMTNGTVAGMLISDLIAGRPNPWAEVFDATRKKESVATREFLEENANVAKRFIGDRIANLRAPEAESLAPGEAGIVRLVGDKVAGYRDEEGILHAVSPKCTHMDCLVQFNTAEKSWDCPCHGSRFTVDGEVIQGPAVEDLERKA